MNTLVVFSGLQRRQSLEEYIVSKLVRLDAKHAPLREAHKLVKLSVENSPRQPGEDIVSCAIHLHSRHLPYFKIYRRGGDIIEAINLALDRFALQVARLKLKHRGRKRRRKADSLLAA